MANPVLRTSSQPERRPEADPYHTGQNNLFKYIAGLDPTNPASLFTLRVQMAAQPGQAQLVFQPALARSHLHSDMDRQFERRCVGSPERRRQQRQRR